MKIGVTTSSKKEADWMETIKKYYRIDRAGIAYVRFILEAYDGIANMTTLDPQQGLVRMAIAPDCTTEMDFIVSDLKKNILIEPVDVKSSRIFKPWKDK